MNNPWIDAGLNAKAYFEAYRALCRMRVSYSRRSSALLAADYISATIDGATMGRRKLFWSRNEKYWANKLKESFKRETDYLQGV